MKLMPASIVAGVCALTATVAAAPPPSTILRARPGNLSLENQRADADDLSRLSSTTMLNRFIRAGLLVAVPASTAHYYLNNIPAAYRYLRPWSKLFLTRLSRQFHARFGKKLRVTSVVRTVGLQNSIAKRNGNAAAAYGPQRSTHLTGATLDISKKGMTGREVAWMREVLHSLKTKEYLHAIEEFQQSAFHVMVFRNYPVYVESLAR